jgi:hypothetical protein
MAVCPLSPVCDWSTCGLFLVSMQVSWEERGSVRHNNQQEGIPLPYSGPHVIELLSSCLTELMSMTKHVKIVWLQPQSPIWTNP